MGDFFNVSNAKQVIIFEIIDAAIMQSISEYKVPSSIEPTKQKLIDALRYDFQYGEGLDEYFEFKEMCFTRPLFNNNPINNIVNLWSIPSRYKGFKIALNAIDKVLAILMELEDFEYDQLQHVVFQVLREDALDEVEGLQAVLHSDKTISFGFKECNNLNAMRLNDFLSERWFLNSNGPLFNQQNEM